MEDFIDTSPLELLKSCQTFISFKGELTTPDLALAHVNLLSKINLELLKSPTGYGHKILLLKLSNNPKPCNQTSDREPRWNLKKANWPKYAILTDNNICRELIVPTNPDSTFKKILKALHECAIQTIPRGNMKQYKPFWNSRLAELKKDRDKARQKAENSGLQTDSQELRRKQAIFKKAVTEEKRAAFKNFVERLDYKKDGKKAYDFLHKLNNIQSNDKNEPFISSSGKEITGNSQKTLALVKYFRSVGQLPRRKEQLCKEPLIGCPSAAESEIFNVAFVMHELKRAMEDIKKGKSAGPDNVLAEMLVNMGHKAKETLLEFYNVVWRTRVPADWRRAEIIPLLKKSKPPTNPASYRPISLTSAFSKLMERLVTNRLCLYLDSRCLLTDYQAGFRKRRSTTEQVAYLSQCIKDGFQRKQSTVAVYVDFKAAYDTVWKPKLIHKLANLGIRGNMFNWLKSFLGQRFIRVKYNNSRSKYIQTKNGLPQGAVISCTLFNIMINDLADELSKLNGVNCLFFADDVVIYATSSNISSISEALNKSLITLEKWCEDNLMTVNTEKTVAQLYTLSTIPHEVDLTYKGNKLETQDSVKYLGISLDKKLNWKKHVQEATKKAESRLKLLKRLSGITWGASQEVLVTTYKTYIRPVLEYGGELLVTTSANTSDALNKVQNKALRVITGAPKSTPIASMEIQTGIDALHMRREANAIKTVEKCLRLPVKQWKDYRPAQSRLSTQITLLTRVEQLREEFGLHWNEREVFRQEKCEDFFSVTPEHSLSIGAKSNKNEELPCVLKVLSLEMIHNKYSETDWVHVYTDGSADPNKNVVGAGYIISDFKDGKVALGKKCTNFDAEIEAVLQAAREVTKMRTGKRKVVFFIDSQAAILALGGCKPSDNLRVENAKKALGNLQKCGWKVNLQWIPSHCGIGGNEQADRAAKEASQLAQPEEPISFIQVKADVATTLKRKSNEYYFNMAEGKRWHSLQENPVPKNLPRKVFTANFRLITGHDYLQEHLFKIGVKESPLCPLCTSGLIMNGSHLKECPGLRDVNCVDCADEWHKKALLYWAARNRMDKMSNS